MIRRLTLSLLFLLALTVGASAVGCAGTGSCFWEGGTGNISDTTKWCTTNTNPCSGTTGSVPTSADNCNFTSVSNATAYTVTVDVTANCKDMTWALPGTSGVPTLTDGATNRLNVNGNLTLVAGMSFTIQQLFFVGATAGKTITTNGVGINSALIDFNAAGGWTLQDNFTNSRSAGTIQVDAGTLNTNAKTVQTPNFVSTSGTRTLTLDNSTINITGTSGTVWNVSTVGALTFSATGSTINVNGGTANTGLTIVPSSGGSLTYNTFNVTAAGLITQNNFGTVKNYSYTSTTNKTDTLSFAAGQSTIAASGSLTIQGNSTVNRAFALSTVLGTQRTPFSVPNTATVSLTNVDFQDIASAGTFGTWTGTSLGDALGNSGITFDGSTTQTRTGSGGNWSSAQWTTRVPLPQDDVIVPAGAGSIADDMPRRGRNIDFSAATGALTAAAGINIVTTFGNITWGASMTIGGEAQVFQGRGAQTFTSNGKSINGAITISAFGGTYTLQDAASFTNSLALTDGTFAGQAFNHTISSLSLSGTAIKAITGSGIWSITDTSGTFVNCTSTANTSTTGFTGTLKFTGNITTTATFQNRNFTWPNIWWASTTSTGTLIIASGGGSFNDFRVNRTTARGITFPAATTTTIASWTDESLGTAVLTVNSSSATSAATLSKSSGMVSTDYLSIRDSAATGGAAFFAGNHSTNTSNNSGWIFSGPGGGGLLTMGVGGWLLNRDLHPANDNHPVGLDQAA